jgi:hypothetical protein
MNDKIADLNQRHWEKMVRERCGFTLPWLDLDPAVVCRYAQGDLPEAPWPLSEMYPRASRCCAWLRAAGSSRQSLGCWERR